MDTGIRFLLINRPQGVDDLKRANLLHSVANLLLLNRPQGVDDFQLPENKDYKNNTCISDWSLKILSLPAFLPLNHDLKLHRNQTHNLGRKNYLFCGNHKAAEDMCVVQSLLSTCCNHDGNPRAYLNEIIANWRLLVRLISEFCKGRTGIIKV